MTQVHRILLMKWLLFNNLLNPVFLNSNYAEVWLTQFIIIFINDIQIIK